MLLLSRAQRVAAPEQKTTHTQAHAWGVFYLLYWTPDAHRIRSAANKYALATDRPGPSSGFTYAICKSVCNLHTLTHARALTPANALANASRIRNVARDDCSELTSRACVTNALTETKERCSRSTTKPSDMPCHTISLRHYQGDGGNVRA